VHHELLVTLDGHSLTGVIRKPFTTGGKSLPVPAGSERKKADYVSEHYLWGLWNLRRLSDNWAAFCLIAVETRH